MDETAGTFNRISYQRSELIRMQGEYNKARRWYPMFGGMFPREQVMGSGADVEDINIPNNFDQQ